MSTHLFHLIRMKQTNIFMVDIPPPTYLILDNNEVFFFFFYIGLAQFQFQTLG